MKKVMMPASSLPSAVGGAEGLEGFGDQTQERGAEQRADREGHEPRHDAGADVLVEEQERGGHQQAHQHFRPPTVRG